jgi:hypothetical protein
MKLRMVKQKSDASASLDGPLFFEQSPKGMLLYCSKSYQYKILYFSLHIFLLRRNSRRLLRASTTSTDINDTTRMDAMVSMSYSFFMSSILQQNIHDPLKKQLTSGKQKCKFIQTGSQNRTYCPVLLHFAPRSSRHALPRYVLKLTSPDRCLNLCANDRRDRIFRRCV